MVAIQTTAAALEHRRRALGITHSALAKRSGVSLATVKRILSGEHGVTGFIQVLKVAEALGLSLEIKSQATIESLQLSQATRKAQQIAGLTQATSSLESQGLDDSAYGRLVREWTHRLMSGSKRKLWVDE
jgi:transcriptional regulator with XRE-family HTH domain